MYIKKNIICHLFYPQVALQLIEKLSHFNKNGTVFFINILGNSKEHNKLYNYIKSFLDDTYILTTPNKGRDIGAKFTLIHLMLLLNEEEDFTLIIHDKKSPYTTGGDQWRDELFKIIAPEYLNKIYDIFERNADVGIVCAANYIQNEYEPMSDSFLSNSNDPIRYLLNKYRIKTKDYNFVAGNVFWIRTKLIRDFFRDRSILLIRSELEEGNKLDFEKGTLIHSWERIMSWIATSQGYKIYGI